MAAVAVDEVKDIRDKAVALEQYAQQARNVDAEKRAASNRIRAELKGGQLYREQAKAKGKDSSSRVFPAGSGCGRCGPHGQAIRSGGGALGFQ